MSKQMHIWVVKLLQGDKVHTLLSDFWCDFINWSAQWHTISWKVSRASLWQNRASAASSSSSHSQPDLHQKTNQEENHWQLQGQTQLTKCWCRRALQLIEVHRITTTFKPVVSVPTWTYLWNRNISIQILRYWDVKQLESRDVICLL